MDNVENQVQDNVQGDYSGNELDLTLDTSETTEPANETVSTNEETTPAETSETTEPNLNLNNLQNNAFAAMRTSNKEYKSVVDDLDAIAKNYGLDGYKDFIEQAKNQMDNQRNTNGKDEDGDDRYSALEARLDRMEKAAIRQEQEAKEARFASQLNDFARNNSYSNADLNNLVQKLAKDGFTVETMTSMPESAVNRILDSYVDKTAADIQRKQNINNELPVSQNSKASSINDLNKLLDAKARELAARNNHFVG